MTRILIVDDEAQVRGMLREAFKGVGYEVVKAQPTISLHVSRFTSTKNAVDGPLV
ncbi:MAG: hypothetical protein O7F12_09525 [Nitrospirae bacterium]|nr:hypothetical protein [Nitrospirota bacterium]